VRGRRGGGKKEEKEGESFVVHMRAQLEEQQL
jgi:hypothetical protein